MNDLSWRVRARFQLPDEEMLRKSLVRRYRDDVAPDLVIRALRARDVRPRIRRLADTEEDLATEVLSFEPLVDELQAFVDAAGVDLLDGVRRRRRKHLIAWFTALLWTPPVLTGIKVWTENLSPQARRDLNAPPVALFWMALAVALLGLAAGFGTIVRNFSVAAGRKAGPKAVGEADFLRLMSAAEEQVIWPRVRRVVNRHLDAEFGPVLAAGAAPGLRDARADRFVVNTNGFREAADRIGQLDSGAVIVTGARGTGKSALIRRVLSQRAADSPIPGGISVMVPSVYDPRDFILHLHSVVCRAVVKHSLGTWWRRALDRMVSATGPARAALSVIAGTAMVLVQVLTSFPFSAGPWRVVVICASGGLAAIGLAGAVVWGTARLAKLTGPRSLLRLARTDLARVSYLQTFTSGWSGKLAVPWGDATFDRSRQIAEQSRSLPEVVADFRSFIARLVDGRHRLVIAIDELDKLADATQAERFIDDIRAILEIPGCVYLTALSNDAMAHFGRRLTTTKTSLDSSFDLAVRMRPMTARESSDALAARVVGFSRHFRLLAHLAAGGRPRELVRMARKLVDHARAHDGIMVEKGARLLVAELADENLHAMVITLRDSTSPGVQALRKAMMTMAPGGDLDDYEDAIRALAKDTVDGDPLWEVLAYHAHLATLRRFFECPEPAAALLDDRGEPTKALTRFETALQILPDDSSAAWRSVADARAIAGFSPMSSL